MDKKNHLVKSSLPNSHCCYNHFHYISQSTHLDQGFDNNYYIYLLSELCLFLTLTEVSTNHINCSLKKILLGAHRIRGDGVTYRINKIIAHGGFSMSHLRNDMALLRLAVPVKLSNKVGTVCFPKSQSRISPGSRCWISGLRS